MGSLDPELRSTGGRKREKHTNLSPYRCGSLRPYTAGLVPDLPAEMHRQDTTTSGQSPTGAYLN